MVVDHLSRLVPESTSLGLPIGDSFPDWYADIVNYLVSGCLNIILMTHICLNTLQTS